MADQTITSRVPQQGDPVNVLLARLLATQSQRVTGTALSMATRTTTTQSATIDCTGFRGIIIYFRVTSAPGTDTVRITVRGLDPVWGGYTMFAQGPGQNAPSATAVSIGPGFTIATGLPDQIRIEVTHVPGPGGPFDYSVGYCLIP
jgi:hypothetical protein